MNNLKSIQKTVKKVDKRTLQDRLKKTLKEETDLENLYRIETETFLVRQPFHIRYEKKKLALKKKGAYLTMKIDAEFENELVSFLVVDDFIVDANFI